MVVHVLEKFGVKDIMIVDGGLPLVPGDEQHGVEKREGPGEPVPLRRKHRCRPAQGVADDGVQRRARKARPRMVQHIDDAGMRASRQHGRAAPSHPRRSRPRRLRRRR